MQENLNAYLSSYDMPLLKAFISALAKFPEGHEVHFWEPSKEWLYMNHSTGT